MLSFPLSMLGRAAALVLLAAGLRSCVAYEYEHEFWLEVDGSGTVFVTGRPEHWATFKGLPRPDADPGALRETARDLFERSGLRVRKVTVTRRDGRPYLFVAADFDDVNRLPGTPAFPDLQIRLAPAGSERLRLEGAWRPPSTSGAARSEGLMAVRFHLPSKVFAHDHAFAGVERGNIVAWRQDLAQGLAGHPLPFGAVMGDRSILNTTVTVFAAAIAGGLGIVARAVYGLLRTGRRRAQAVVVADPRSRGRGPADG
ncbi:MAG TPA: hypothetical protein VMT87_11530 [Vicinamibacteria bacterium]|nr:hypothetical protein [Vicinamibacteria bacterium]